MQYREVTASNGFSSQGDQRLLFGMDDYDGTVSVEVSWCSKDREQFNDLSLNRYHMIEQNAFASEATVIRTKTNGDEE